MPVGEPYDVVREGSRVLFMDGTEGRILKVHKRNRPLLTPWRLTPPLFEIEHLSTGTKALMHGNVIDEVLDY
jgi:hypothetical protein